jgi:hypothetical protein
VRERRSTGPEVAVERELLYGPDEAVDASGATAEETVTEVPEVSETPDAAAPEAAGAPEPADAEPSAGDEDAV